jgi:hypothetical protein
MPTPVAGKVYYVVSIEEEFTTEAGFLRSIASEASRLGGFVTHLPGMKGVVVNFSSIDSATQFVSIVTATMPNLTAELIGIYRW